METCTEGKVKFHSKIKTPVLRIDVPVLGVKLIKLGDVDWLFSKIDSCSAISFKRYRRELFIDVAERTTILKNNQNTYYPSFSFTSKTHIAFLKNGCFVINVV